jgi:hypothetical protein
MSKIHIKAGRSGNYPVASAQGIAVNSFTCESGELLKKIASGSDNFVGSADAGDSIIGLSRTEKDFDSDNQTVAKEKVNYTPISQNDTLIIDVTGQSITFSAALVTSNTINLKVNGVAMTEVTYATSNDATLEAIATQIVTDFGTVVDAAVRSGTRSILITPKGANSTVVISNVVVAAGASNATATIADLALTDGDRAKYYDISEGQYVNLASESTATGQLKLVSAVRKEFEVVNL